jgi:hypothetical protein
MMLEHACVKIGHLRRSCLRKLLAQQDGFTMFRAREPFSTLSSNDPRSAPYQPVHACHLFFLQAEEIARSRVNSDQLRAVMLPGAYYHAHSNIVRLVHEPLVENIFAAMVHGDEMEPCDGLPRLLHALESGSRYHCRRNAAQNSRLGRSNRILADPW